MHWRKMPGGMFYKYQLSTFLIILFVSSICLPSFGIILLYIIENGMLKCPTIIVAFSVFPCWCYSFCLYSEAYSMHTCSGFLHIDELTSLSL